jgi:Cft2 family RNA processing exonuclease
LSRGGTINTDTPLLVPHHTSPDKYTLLDANHCPGAVMFLFEVGRRHTLYVEDFRWNRDRMYAGLKDFITLKIRLDDLFLDTTYCDEKYHLPTQDEAIAATVAKAVDDGESCRKAGNRLLMLFGAYTIGIERIFLAVAETLGVKVYVDKTH